MPRCSSTAGDWANDLLDLFEADPEIREREKVRIDIIRRFGYFSTESNGHLSEYLPWYRKRPDEIRDWISTDAWILGETGGYLRVCTENRNWFETDFPKWRDGPAWDYAPEKRSDEHGSYIIESMTTGRMYRGHFNVRNDGVVTNLPPDAIVEVPGYVDRNGLSIPVVGDLPLGCAAICNNSIQVQRMATQAAVTGDVELLKQAILLDPFGRRRMQSARGLANGRRDARRPGGMATPVRRGDRRCPAAPCQRAFTSAWRHGGSRAAQDALGRGTAGGCRLMRYVIYGAGGIGGTIGARLHQAGFEVCLIARGDHYRAIQRDGLRFVSPTQDVFLDIPCADHPRDADISPDDAVILCMKGQHTEEALRDLYAATGGQAHVICCQNGVENEPAGAQAVPPHTTAWSSGSPPSTSNPASSSTSPRTPLADSTPAAIRAASTTTSPRVTAALTKAGFSAEPDADIMRHKYEKLLANLSNAVNAATGEGSREIARVAARRGARLLRRRGNPLRNRRGDTSPARHHQRCPGARPRPSRGVIAAEHDARDGGHRDGFPERGDCAAGAAGTGSMCGPTRSFRRLGTGWFAENLKPGSMTIAELEGLVLDDY